MDQSDGNMRPRKRQRPDPEGNFDVTQLVYLTTVVRQADPAQAEVVREIARTLLYDIHDTPYPRYELA